MLSLLDLGPGDIWAVRVEGTLESEDFDLGMATLDDRLLRPGDVRCYVEADDMDHVSFGAMIKDILYGLRHVADVPRFDRFAVVGDQRWLQVVAKIEDTLLPGVDLRAFPSTERDRAREWITEPPE